jgi:dTDP-glucose 4,6-dehydratase
MKILVTGGAGFIGANFVHYMLAEHPDYQICVVDSLTDAGDQQRLSSVADKISFVEADINDIEALDPLVKACDWIVHFAAETHVDKSIENPGVFLQTNILGTDNLARLAIKHKVKRFHHVSTDEAFGTLELDSTDRFNEATPYHPRSPYSASKAASDHLVRAYGETYGLQYTITNSSNNYGPWDSLNRIVPLFISLALAGKKLPLYGDGKSVRDWLHVSDHCRAIDLVLHKAPSGQTYCVGASAEHNGLEIAQMVLEAVGKSKDLIEFVPDRPGHDRRYGIDATKIQKDLGWSPSTSFAEGLEQTIQWYVKHQDWWRLQQDKPGLAEWRKGLER